MIHVDRTAFLEIFGRIFAAYARKEGIFETHSATETGPQLLFRPSRIEAGSAEHLYWLALVAFSDRRTNSTQLYKNFARMFSRNRKLFQRGYYPSLKRMERLFRMYRIAVPVTEIALFIQRKRHLDECFEGNPLKIYEGITDADSLMKKLKRVAKQHGIKNIIPGAKEKIFCLLAMFLREYVTLDFADVIPVDVWVQAVAASTGTLSGVGHTKYANLERQMRPLVTEVFAPHLNVTGAANATWILGKFGCTHCSRTSMRGLCPVYDSCKGPFERAIHPKTGQHLGVIALPLKHKEKKL